jgi:hypothetical protein
MATPAAILSVLVQANGVTAATRDLNRLDKAGNRASGGMTKVQKAAGAAGLALGAGLAVAAKAGFQEMAEGQKVSAQTAAVLKSTGGAAKVTSSEISRLATALSRKSGVDDEVIQSGQNMLLTFTNIRNEVGKGNDIFNQATSTITDMSVALGQDMKSSAIQLGKALNDPIKGVTALQRVGVTFTEGQKKTIEALVQSGDKMKAQKVILAELNKEFGGSAEAAGNTLPGQLNKLKNSFDDVAGGLVAGLLPVMQTFANRLARVGRFLQDHPGFAKALATALAALAVVLGTVSVATKVAAAAQVLWTTATKAATVATKLWSAATKAATIAMVALNVVLRLNPIMLVVTALIALGAALVTAYKKSETFRRIVDGAFSKVKSVAINTFEAIKSAIDPVLNVFEDIVAAVKDVIHFIGKIKVPDISLPFGIGGKGGGNVGPTFGPLNGVQAIADASVAWGLSGGRGPGQGFRPGDDGWHGQNRARDLSGSPAAMLGFAKMLFHSMGPKLLELIYTPLGIGIKNGKPVNIRSFYGPAVAADHYDHVHVAMRRGGKVPGSQVGDRVPALLEAGEFVVRKKIVDKFGPTFFAGLNGMAAGGIAGAVDAARGAGFRGEDLVRAVAIAGAESRYNPKAQNLKYPDHSIGLWQINQLAHKGRFGSDAQLKNPATNAKAAFKLFRESGFRPWSTWPTAAKGFMDRARAAVKASQGKGGGGGGGATDSWGTVGGSTGKAKFGPAKTGGGGGGGGGNGEDPAQAERDRVAAELLAINTQIAQNQLKILALAGQGDQIVGAVVAAVNGGIGGRVGLGFHGIRSTPGSVANL